MLGLSRDVMPTPDMVLDYSNSGEPVCFKLTHGAPGFDVELILATTYAIEEQG